MEFSDHLRLALQSISQGIVPDLGEHGSDPEAVVEATVSHMEMFDPASYREWQGLQAQYGWKTVYKEAEQHVAIS